MSKHSRQYLQFKDDQSLQVGNAVNRDKNKLSIASALIWKEEVVTEGNLGNIFHWTNHTRLGQIQEEKTQLAGGRETTQA